SSVDFAVPWEFRVFPRLDAGPQGPVTVYLHAGDGYHLTSDRDGRALLVVFHHQLGERSRAWPPQAEFWDLGAGKRLPALPAPVGGTDPRVCWDGLALLSVNGDDSTARGFTVRPDGSVCWWDTATGRPLGEVWRPRREAPFSALTLDSLLLAARCQDQRVRLYDLATRRQRRGGGPGVGPQ